MPAYLTLDDISAACPDGRRLFEHLTLTVGAERVGLVGRNGSGKSTLIAIAAGERAPVSGSVHHGGAVARLRQGWPEAVPLSDLLGATEMLARLARIEAGAADEADLSGADWMLPGRLEAALAGMGLELAWARGDFDRPVGSLSGGERMRAALAGLTISGADLLLLDEPTNDLDADGRAAATRMIADWRGGVLVASHDRALLESMDRIIELSPTGVGMFGGGWSDFAEARAAARERAAVELERADAAMRGAAETARRQRERKARRDKAGRAFAARGSEPKILLGRQAERAENSVARDRHADAARMEAATARRAAAAAAVAAVTPLHMDLPATGLPANRQVLALRQVVAAAGERRLGPWSLTVTGPERIVVTGPNGAGKTRLLRIAAGLDAAAAGEVKRAEGRVAMLDQHVALLDPALSVLDNIRRRHPGMGAEDAHALAARFAFRNRDATKPAGVLSGGERMRAGLACLMGGEAPPWLLLLDEPTNHLDMEANEILEAALADYDGALIVASHDPAFLEAIGIERRFDVRRGEGRAA